MNKGYAFGFLIVLLVVALGFYVALTGFLSTRETLQALPTPPPADTGVADLRPTAVVPTAASAASSISETATFSIPTPVPGITATLTAMAQSTESQSPAETAAPVTAAPPSATPEPVQPTPTVVSQAPPTPGPVYQFRLEGPPAPDAGYPTCCYIYGTVWDLAGVPLEGVRVVASNEWITLDPALSKGGGEAGQYNIPLGQDVVTWDLVIVDAAGNQISTKATVPFDPGVANGYRVDWQRTY